MLGRSLRTLGGAAGLGAVLLGAEVAWAVTRPLPTFDNLDATGIEGDPEAPPLTMAVLGDSSCTGPGLDDPSEIWARVFARKIGDRHRVDVRSVAVGGATAADVVRDQLADTLALRPDIALVSVGGNDALRGVSRAVFTRHLTTIVTVLVSASPIVVLSGVGDLSTIPRLVRPLSDVARARARVFNAIHHQVGGRLGAVVADQWRWSSELFRDDLSMFAPDHFHASAAGHEVWAQVAYEVIEPHLARLETR